jgi:hypothetical protein
LEQQVATLLSVGEAEESTRLDLERCAEVARARVAALEKEKTAGLQFLQTTSRAASEARERIAVLEECASTNEAELAAKTREVASLSMDVAYTRGKIEKSQQKATALHGALEEARGELEEQRAVVNSQSVRIEKLEKVKMTDDIRSRVEKLQGRKKQLKKENAKLKAMVQELEKPMEPTERRQRVLIRERNSLREHYEESEAARLELERTVAKVSRCTHHHLLLSARDSVHSPPPPSLSALSYSPSSSLSFQAVHKRNDCVKENEAMREDMLTLQRRLDSLRAEMASSSPSGGTVSSSSSSSTSTQSVAFLEKENYTLILENENKSQRIEELEATVAAAAKKQMAMKKTSMKKAAGGRGGGAALGARSLNVARR